jgi:hypothetical protein
MNDLLNSEYNVYRTTKEAEIISGLGDVRGKVLQVEYGAHSTGLEGEHYNNTGKLPTIDEICGNARYGVGISIEIDGQMSFDKVLEDVKEIYPVIADVIPAYRDDESLAMYYYNDLSDRGYIGYVEIKPKYKKVYIAISHDWQTYKYDDDFNFTRDESP